MDTLHVLVHYHIHTFTFVPFKTFTVAGLHFTLYTYHLHSTYAVTFTQLFTHVRFYLDTPLLVGSVYPLFTLCHLASLPFALAPLVFLVGFPHYLWTPITFPCPLPLTWTSPLTCLLGYTVTFPTPLGLALLFALPLPLH